MKDEEHASEQGPTTAAGPHMSEAVDDTDRIEVEPSYLTNSDKPGQSGHSNGGQAWHNPPSGSGVHQFNSHYSMQARTHHSN